MSNWDDPRVAFRYRALSTGGEFSRWFDCTKDEFKKFLVANKRFNGRPNFDRVEVAVIGSEELWYWTPKTQWTCDSFVLNIETFIEIEMVTDDVIRTAKQWAAHRRQLEEIREMNCDA